MLRRARVVLQIAVEHRGDGADERPALRPDADGRPVEIDEAVRVLQPQNQHSSRQKGMWR